MYLALRWLICLSLAMWVAMCCIDLYFERNKGNICKGFLFNLYKTENISNIVNKEIIESNGRKSRSSKQFNATVLHYAMFFAGAFAVSIFNRKREIMLYTRKKLIYMNSCTASFKIHIKHISLKRTAMKFSVAIVEYTGKLWRYSNAIMKDYLTKRKALHSNYRINMELLKKIKEYVEERKNLNQLLMSAIHENKNIRLRYQIETTAKNRLLQYIEDTQKQIKENRSKYVSFQHLYLITHQENIFLKAHLKKLCKEKEEAEKNLLNLVTEVYQSKSSELKAYCSRFVVGTRKDLLNYDANAEIHKFMSKNSKATCSYQDSSDHFVFRDDNRIADIMSDDKTLTPHISEAPKLKGLPGECIWTVKDKDGIIEKLYEYDYETDYDKGDTIRRIRKYSVYHDKSCLLDITNSNTALCDISSTTVSLEHQQYIKVEHPITCQRFLTGSQAFQNFLKENHNFVHRPISSRPALLCQ